MLYHLVANVVTYLPMWMVVVLNSLRPWSSRCRVFPLVANSNAHSLLNDLQSRCFVAVVADLDGGSFERSAIVVLLLRCFVSNCVASLPIRMIVVLNEKGRTSRRLIVALLWEIGAPLLYVAVSAGTGN